jgi:hypothetical protein
MGKIRRWAKFAWLYTSSMFLPTAIVTPRVEKALQELEEDRLREERAKRGLTA